MRLFGFLRADTGSRFRRNFIKVARANVLAQALPLLALPLLTRLYSPTDFGVAALFASALSLLVAFSVWRFDWSVPNASSRFVASGLMAVGLVLLLSFTLVVFSILWFWGEQLSFWEGYAVLGPLLFLLPIAMLGSGLTDLLQSWYVRNANLSTVGTARIAQSAAGTGMNVVGGVAGLGALGLIIGTVSSAWVGIGLLLRHAQGLRYSLTRLTTLVIKVGLVRYWRESTISTMVAVINASSLAVIPFLLVQFYGVQELGWYALMYRIAVNPIGLLTGAVGQSFWAEAALLIRKDRKELLRIYLNYSKKLAMVAIPVLILCIAGPLYVGVILGEDQWGGAGYVLAALAPMLAGYIVVQPLTHLVVHQKQKWKLYLDSVRAVVTVLLIIMLSRSDIGLNYLVFCLSLVSLFSYVCLFYLNLTCLKNNA